MIKDKARMHQVQRHELPDKVVVKLADLEEKVLTIYNFRRFPFPQVESICSKWICRQGKKY
jgi:hypothetical protein